MTLPLVGHFAFEKTLNRVKQRFWWPSMRLDIEKGLLWCLPCAARTTTGRKLKQKLYGEPYEPSKVWLYSKQKAKSKNFIVYYEGTHIIQETTSEVNYMIHKKGKPRKTRIVHFSLLNPYNEEQTGDASGKNKRPTPDFFARFLQ